MKPHEYEKTAQKLDADFVSGEIIAYSASQLRPKPIQWLWREWLACGKLHILAGEPGQGKTTIAVKLAATITNGGQWPDGSFSPVGNVVIWSGEDDPEDTLVPRLEAANGNLDRCYFIGGTKVKGRIQAFNPSSDIPALTKFCTAIGEVRLLILDPIVSAISGDGNSNTDVRRDLQPLVDFASHKKIALLGITHFRKGGSEATPINRVTGSIAFSAVPRVVMVAAKVSVWNDAEKRVLVRAKSNIGHDGDGFEYSIDLCNSKDNIQTTVINWGCEVNGSAHELLSDEVPKDENLISALESAIDFLKEVLKDKPLPNASIMEQAKELGISKSTLDRAKKRLRIKPKKYRNEWVWQLPPS